MTAVMETEIQGFTLRFAEEGDVPVILGLIKELAEYENLSHQVVATEEILRDSLFRRNVAEVVLGEYEGSPVGLILYFYNFSTFLGKPGIYLEDLYIKPEMRGKGMGKILLTFLAKLAVERDCGRLEWSCLDWNEPSIGFYKQMGAVPMDEWTVYRLTGDSLAAVAGTFRDRKNGFT